jgi:hypothetical protein
MKILEEYNAITTITSECLNKLPMLMNIVKPVSAIVQKLYLFKG